MRLKSGKVVQAFDLYGSVRLVASAPGYERVEMPLAIYGANDETPLRVRIALEPEPLRAHLGAILKDSGAGVHVFSVQPEGPADKVGLRPGDYLLSVDGGAVKNVAEVREVLRGRKPGSPLRLGIRRRTEQDLEVTPVTRPSELTTIDARDSGEASVVDASRGPTWWTVALVCVVFASVGGFLALFLG